MADATTGPTPGHDADEPAALTEAAGLSTPESPQHWEPGQVAKDAATGRVGRVMGREGPRYQLRPLNGGVEWEALPGNLSPAYQSDAMSPAVAEVNARPRWGM
jgi:hypothetical protein